jgi:maleamate amidohydrolase
MDAGLARNYGGVFDGKLGFGARPALLIVDFIDAYVNPAAPFYTPDAIEAVRQAAILYRSAKRARLPVIFTRVIYSRDGSDGGIFVQKVPALRKLVEGEPTAEFAKNLRPATDDVVVTKQYASAFFGTSLASLLTARGVDTVVLTGVSTSGCIRASAVDAMQHGFRVSVPVECVADRHPGPHQANLFDINAKYGDVVGIDSVLAYFDSLHVEDPRTKRA